MTSRNVRSLNNSGRIEPAATVITALILIFALDCSAQSLADAAKKERERQKTVQSKVVVAPGTTVTSKSGTSSTGAAAPPSAASAPGAAGKQSGPVDNKGHDEKYWRAAFQKARDDSKRAEDRAQLMDLKLKNLNTQLLRQSDMYNRENRLGPEITAAQKELDDALKEADQAKQKISELEDELRKSGGPPGWSR